MKKQSDSRKMKLAKKRLAEAKEGAIAYPKSQVFKNSIIKWETKIEILKIMESTDQDSPKLNP